MEERALPILKAMLEKRGIQIPNVQTLANPMDDTAMYEMGGILVIFSHKNRITAQNIPGFLEFAKGNSYTKGLVLISMGSIPDKVYDVIRDHISNPENYPIQIFELRHVQFDITNHRKVPAHRILNSDEKTKLEEKFHITNLKTQLPLIDSQDATPYYRYCVAQS
jgi:DNA-directed RNA polymerase subunit H (RpoH/RPB5)